MEVLSVGTLGFLTVLVAPGPHFLCKSCVRSGGSFCSASSLLPHSEPTFPHEEPLVEVILEGECTNPTKF